MIRSILAREDSIYKAFPDIAMTSDGTLVCVYRESLFHGGGPFTRVIVQHSRDGGLNWDKKQTIQAYEDSDQDGILNDPRILSLGDNRLLLICDWIPPNQPERSPESELFLWRSNDSGQSWSEMEKVGIKGRICLSLHKIKSNKIILGCNKLDESNGVFIYEAYISSDLDCSCWEGPIEVAPSPSNLFLNEGSFVQLDNGSIICYRREDRPAICAYKAISKDEGKTWEGPYPTHLLACRGRPQAGLLRSGEVAITYGFDMMPRQLVLHVETQSIAADPNCVKKTVAVPPIKRKKGESFFLPTTRRFFIDHDRSIHPDAGYSGWVQLPSGDLYVVQYIVDDAPMAHIRSYRINRSDWILCPEGKLIRAAGPGITTHHELKKSSYHEISVKASEDQYRKVYKEKA